MYGDKKMAGEDFIYETPMGRVSLLRRGSLEFWLTSPTEIRVGSVAVELPYQRAGVATRLFEEMRRRHPEVTTYRLNAASLN